MIIKNGFVYLSKIEDFKKTDIKIQNEKIVEISDSLSGDETLDANGLLILPGGIDPHVHFNEPGFTQREDFYHGSMSAAAGGITTVIDMPCTSLPPVVDEGAFLNKLSEVGKNSVVDFLFHGGVSGNSYKEGFPQNMKELSKYVASFKTYFTSGMETFKSLKLSEFKNVLIKARDLGKTVLLHAEDSTVVDKETRLWQKKSNLPLAFYKSRPEKAEKNAISQAAKLAKETGANLHICHIGIGDVEEELSIENVTGETCPHYLEFDLNDFLQMGSVLKIAPPLKSAGNREKLWEHVKSGKINFIASDHAPCPESFKSSGSIWTDYAGISGVQTLLPYIFSEGYMKKRISIKRFVEIVSLGAALRFGLNDKGSIEVGKDADLVFIDPKKSWRVKGEEFYSKGKITPFEEKVFQGRIIRTILRGKTIYSTDDGILAKKGFGKFLIPNKVDNKVY